MFLRSNKRIKDGKEHLYYSVVESRRVSSGRVEQNQVLYLGEINTNQAAWRKTLEVFDEQEGCCKPVSLYPEEREVPADALDSVQVKLSGMNLERPRAYGNCWLGCQIWEQLELTQFLETEAAKKAGKRGLGACAGVASGELADRSRQ